MDRVLVGRAGDRRSGDGVGGTDDMRNRPCDECAWCNGEHAEWCQSRGYAFVGPHPDAPVPETVRVPGPAELEQCPCGRPRAGCDYHDPALQPAATPVPARVGVSIAEYDVYDHGGGAFTIVWWKCPDLVFK